MPCMTATEYAGMCHLANGASVHCRPTHTQYNSLCYNTSKFIRMLFWVVGQQSGQVRADKRTDVWPIMANERVAAKHTPQTHTIIINIERLRSFLLLSVVVYRTDLARLSTANWLVQQYRIRLAVSAVQQSNMHSECDLSCNCFLFVCQTLRLFRHEMTYAIFLTLLLAIHVLSIREETPIPIPIVIEVR